MTKTKSETYFDLMEIIEGQNSVIVSQNSTISRLLNDNLEKENFINEVLNGCNVKAEEK